MLSGLARLDPRRGVTTVGHPLAPRVLEVARVEELSPLLRRVVLTGDRAGTVPFPPWSSGDHVKLSFPDAAGAVAVPRLENGRPVWDGPRPELRDYTIRFVDPAANELVLDGVLHDHGPAGRWFAAARPGDRLGVLGPRGSHLYPPGYRHLILAGDEAALPALGRWLDEPGLSGHVTVVAVASSPEAYPLTTPPVPATVDWRRHVAPLDADRGALFAHDVADALRTSPTPEDVFVWAAGEAEAMKAVRRVLREAGHPRHAFHVDGYWRRGVAGFDHHAVEED
ncbi:siderophore-interacting protein [Propioniciclava coleopterorum]|uniref:Siderophore-interacting protein n=1 Tax=Propioniciclava coleopterorum TaxID=2714937 RepID=A0A6G7Y5P5_9ACTN|nr:siderophore-interacting protein [Propioniciclava coleopterorum]QIK72103.1 siderophore-interacting protein [Propioniciclava coleopterorum]